MQRDILDCNLSKKPIVYDDNMRPDPRRTSSIQTAQDLGRFIVHGVEAIRGLMVVLGILLDIPSLVYLNVKRRNERMVCGGTRSVK